MAPQFLGRASEMMPVARAEDFGEISPARIATQAPVRSPSLADPP
jgi:hypothetical protein